MFWKFLCKTLAQFLKDNRSDFDEWPGIKIIITIICGTLFLSSYALMILFMFNYPGVFELISVVFILFFVLDLISFIMVIFLW